MSKITIKGTCPRCQRDWEVTVDEANYQSFKEDGMLAQRAFPELSPAERELLITGFCDDCWQDMFPPEDEDINEMSEEEFKEALEELKNVQSAR